MTSTTTATRYNFQLASDHIASTQVLKRQQDGMTCSDIYRSKIRLLGIS
ncbi:MAG: hypothetical protein JNN15_08095 [Blastocatellia bacterium]|nr:hypothetical protein [Blastocatellia bacterium]